MASKTPQRTAEERLRMDGLEEAEARHVARVLYELGEASLVEAESASAVL